ncbi:MAG: hypothetical protein M0Z51_04190 [Propionibacterium sp.]|nr:hypothetical protein [Propionibacterium sp.]
MNSFAMALAEVRLPPARFVALVAALVLAVGFVAATQVNMATESHAARARGALWAWCATPR